MMDDRRRYETVKSRLRAMGQGTAQQVHDAIEPSPYSVREVDNTLDELALAEQDEFEKVGEVYRWKKQYRYGLKLFQHGTDKVFSSESPHQLFQTRPALLA